MNKEISSLISTLPSLPGCYLMYNLDNQVIYVGKAKNLLKRVSQYFLRPQSGKVHAMVQNIARFETIVTNNEKEALILEYNLVKKYYPKYNVMLKDGKHYPYIALYKKNDLVLKITRNNKEKNYYYFGPYPNSKYANKLIDLLNQLFPLRKCNRIPKQVCLYYHMGQCLAPCVNTINEEEITLIRNNIYNFLNGNNTTYIREQKHKMQTYSKHLEFERANECKEIINAINEINMMQIVEINNQKDIDVFAYFTSNSKMVVSNLIYRQGLLLGNDNILFDPLIDEEESFISYVYQYYQTNSLPAILILPNQKLVDYFKNIFQNIAILTVNLKKNRLLINLATKNAINYMNKTQHTTDEVLLLEQLKNILGLSAEPKRIDLFDNSHISGDYPVGVAVSFINGKSNKKLYRKFRLEADNSQDDLKNMQEIVHRRYHQDLSSLPNLILVDGDDRQARAAVASISQLGLKIPVYGLYKNHKHQTEGIVDINGGQYLIENKELVFLLTRMQDEVHRFAITYHRHIKGKGIFTNSLLEIKWVGKKTSELLLKKYKTIEAIKNLSLADLEKIVGKKIANEIYHFYHNSE